MANLKFSIENILSNYPTKDHNCLESTNSILRLSNSSYTIKKERQKRTVFRKYQLNGLEAAYQVTNYLTLPYAEQIGHALNLSGKQVMTWFQNRRYNTKSQHRVDQQQMNIITFTEYRFNKIHSSKHSTRQCALLDQCVRTKLCSSNTDAYNMAVYKLLGDKMLQLMFVLYCASVQPYAQMVTVNGSEAIVTRMLITYLSSAHVVQMCKNIGLDNLCQYSPNETQTVDTIHESIFKTWIGVCSTIYDFEIVKKFVFVELFAKLDIRCSYEHLNDARTRLNDYSSANNGRAHVVDKVRVVGGHWVCMKWQRGDVELYKAEGFGGTEMAAEMDAAQKLLAQLERSVDYHTNLQRVYMYRVYRDAVKPNIYNNQNDVPKSAQEIVKFSNDQMRQWSHMSNEQVNALVSSVRTKLYAQVTHTRNLEFYELLGDKLLQYMLVLYCITKQPYSKLTCVEFGEVVITKIVVKYLASKYLNEMCIRVGLPYFIKKVENESKHLSKIYEDVFEAWIGACCTIYNINIVKDYLFEIFRWLHMYCTFDSLNDARTRLNNLESYERCRVHMELKHGPNGTCAYAYWYPLRESNQANCIQTIGHGETPQEAKENAAKEMLKVLAARVKICEQEARSALCWHVVHNNRKK